MSGLAVHPNRFPRRATSLTDFCATTVIFPSLHTGALAQLADPAERAHAYAGRSKSEATIRAYAAGWRDFLQFREQRDVSALPASDQTVAAYLAHEAVACRGAFCMPPVLGAYARRSS